MSECKGRATKVEEIKAIKGSVRQVLYKVDPPVEYEPVRFQGKQTTDHVIVSASMVALSGPETYIFPADSEGKVLDWAELPGSFRGELDHTKALLGAGYCVVDDG